MKLAAAVLLAGWSLTLTAHASVERFAVIIGNNRGSAEDLALHYAESDATRVFEVLRDIGGFQPADMVLLRGENADTIQQTLITVNDRIRAAISLQDTRVMLFVYYSGHADAEDLQQELFIHRIKRFRAVATRYEKTALHYLSLVHLVCAYLWLNSHAPRKARRRTVVATLGAAREQPAASRACARRSHLVVGHDPEFRDNR